MRPHDRTSTNLETSPESLICNLSLRAFDVMKASKREVADASVIHRLSKKNENIIEGVEYCSQEKENVTQENYPF